MGTEDWSRRRRTGGRRQRRRADGRPGARPDARIAMVEKDAQLGGNHNLVVSVVRLKTYPHFAPAENAVEDPQLAEVFRVTAERASDLHEKGLLHAALNLAELSLWGDENEIVPVHYTAEVTLRVLVAARTGLAADKAHRCQLGCQKGVPSRWGISSAIEAAVQPRALAGGALLGGQVDEDLPSGHGVEVCLPGVDHQELAAATAVGSAGGGVRNRRASRGGVAAKNSADL